MQIKFQKGIPATKMVRKYASEQPINPCVLTI